ncbi:hypothetical protein CSC74_11840 [Pseudoxanthomonas yeongjuensis]|uniref:hypothetical protein n=1 Tax=Pseudoxanthomonas yeongjuensis TaxID=377616 RepID=UPI001390C187|nr:hypothetical protein [Pseudoxanthomonas yeongjuensis]KAF1716502.1 hypothetical protein CSC74_11840 [Pseudoxanthomonas yeongjuensis]
MTHCSAFSPDAALVATADLLAQELAEVRPLGVARFERRYEYQPLIGGCANFIGYGSDGLTSLEISYLSPTDPRAVDALSCIIARGEKRIYVSDYLAHVGHDRAFLSNFPPRPPDEFVRSAIGTLATLGRFHDLSAALAGADVVKIPFDYEGYR